MSRVACSLVLLAVVSAPARGADLPPGAIARLGDDRFRTGGPVSDLAPSPDGKQFATVHHASSGLVALTVWESETGRPVHTHKVNTELFMGLTWSKGGALAVTRRAEAGTKEKPAKILADDFRVWDFADPKAAPPLVPLFTGRQIHDRAPRYDTEYTDFRFAADGSRVAARWKSDGGKHVIHVFELKPADTAAKLARVGVIDLGVEGADEIRLSADGKTLVAFRKLANHGPSECTATAWDVATGKPGKPVRVPFRAHLMPTLNALALIAFASDEKEWGFDRYDLANGRHQPTARWKHASGGSPCPIDSCAFAFSTADPVLAVVVGRQTLVIDTVAGRELGRLDGQTSAPTAVAVSADGAIIATANQVGLVRLWNAKTFRPLHDAPGHRAPVEHAELSPDGKRLLTWAPDETVRLWDVATGKELRAFADATDDSRPVFASGGTAVVYSSKKSLIARDLQTGLEVPLPDGAKELKPRTTMLSTERLSAVECRETAEIHLNETASGELRRPLSGHRGRVNVLGFTPDGTKLLTAGEDHTVLVWDMRLQSAPLPDAIKKETNAAKLWDTLATGKAEAAYLAMARLSREPDAALKLLKMKLKPGEKDDAEIDAAKLTDCRAIELLEALGTDESLALLKELAGGHATAFRTQEAKRALERHK